MANLGPKRICILFRSSRESKHHRDVDAYSSGTVYPARENGFLFLTMKNDKKKWIKGGNVDNENLATMEVKEKNGEQNKRNKTQLPGYIQLVVLYTYNHRAYTNSGNILLRLLVPVRHFGVYIENCRAG